MGEGLTEISVSMRHILLNLSNLLSQFLGFYVAADVEDKFVVQIFVQSELFSIWKAELIFFHVPLHPGSQNPR